MQCATGIIKHLLFVVCQLNNRKYLLHFAENLTIKGKGKAQQKPFLRRSVTSLHTNVNFFQGKQRTFWLELIILLHREQWQSIN